MNKAVIRPFGISTTQLGFGCSSLLGLLSARESRALIDAAYDAGIRHFDVARSYGYGAAEALLGKTLGSRRPQVTITSKFGLAAPRNRRLVQMARALLRPLVKRWSPSRSRPRSALARITPQVSFTAEEARRSLEASLKELRTDYLDLFLLHEASAESLIDSGLLEFLHRAVDAGKIRGYGVGSQLVKWPRLLETRLAYCPVVQHEWSVLTADVEIPASSFRITHGSLLRSFPAFRRASQADANFTRWLSEAVGADASKSLAALMLRSAVLRHPDSIVLFSARTPGRIQENVQHLSNPHLDPACVRFAEFLRSRRDELMKRDVPISW